MFDDARWLIVIAFASMIEAIAAGIIGNWLEKRRQQREEQMLKAAELRLVQMEKDAEDREEARIRASEQRAVDMEKAAEDREEGKLVAEEQRAVAIEIAKELRIKSYREDDKDPEDMGALMDKVCEDIEKRLKKTLAKQRKELIDLIESNKTQK